MSNPSKKKGTAAETRVVKYLLQHGIGAERRALSGVEDKGDIKVDAPGWVGSDLIFEVKAGKQTINPNRSQINEWMRQTMVEGKNANSSALLVIARHGKNIADYDVWGRLSDKSYMIHWYLDEWCKAFE